MPSLLDSDSKVSLIHQASFKEHLLPRIMTPMGGKVDAHALFSLNVVNNGQLPVKMYIEMDVNLLGLKVPNVCFLIKMSYKTSMNHRLEYAMAHSPGCHEKIWGRNI